MTSMVIRTEALTRDFKSTRAVDHLTIDVPRGILFGFLGPNGSGKTTTIRILLGLLEPTSGRAEVLGFDTKSQADKYSAPGRSFAPAEAQRIGNERLSARGITAEFYGRVARIPAAKRGRKRDQGASRSVLNSGIGAKSNAGTWSRGMKQNLRLLSTMVHRPGNSFSWGWNRRQAWTRSRQAWISGRTGWNCSARRRYCFSNRHNLVEAEKM